MDPMTQATDRVNDLLQQMTLEEKIGQLTQLGKYIPDTVPIDDRIRQGQVGSILWLSDPAEINRLQHIAVEQSRLHIPLLFGLDVIHGLRTIFPMPLALAASWDPCLVEQVQAVAAREARALGEAVLRRSGVPVSYWDERLSTAAALRSARHIPWFAVAALELWGETCRLELRHLPARQRRQFRDS
jgi:hypothetical protein